MDQELRLEDMFQDAFIAPTINAMVGVGPLQSGQSDVHAEQENDAPNVGTSMQLKEDVTSALQQECAKVDEMGVESQSMEEGNLGNGDNVEALFDNVWVDHANQNIDGMSEPSHGGDHYYGVPSVLRLNEACQPLFLGA
jgi:hypothetical protein